MASQQDGTSSFYSQNAAAYAARLTKPNTARLAAFLGRLAPDAEILELGCGGGRDTAVMIERGRRVTPTDGTPEMAQEASIRLGIPVKVLRFEDIDAENAFDGIWANACLLHVQRAELGGILAKIHDALRSGGVFYASFKAGETDGLDERGRYYNYPSRQWLLTAYQALPWSSIEIGEGRGTGFDNLPTDWLYVTAVKTD